MLRQRGNRFITGVTLPEPAAHPQAGQPSSLSPGPPRCIAPSPRHLLTSPAAQGSPAAGNTVLHSSTSRGETLFFLNKNGLPVTGKGREEGKIAGRQPVSVLSAPSSPAPRPFVPPVACDSDGRNAVPRVRPPGGLLPTPFSSWPWGLPDSRMCHHLCLRAKATGS